ncbi:uncharacterized protein LOC132295002 [Cornus florida]|uniref:uncharacterized protein LOC132295002 n=1 Tax=Cornus florida TaxID=4283 RepID=UPI0028A1BC07|nr:uncharacterized protein LOC132295002 [Cornus florida]
MENDMRDDMVMDLDLNQEPSEPPGGVGLGSLLNELETAHGQIEERIRQLEAVTARARQRQRWRQSLNLPVASNISTELIDNLGGVEVRNGENSLGAQERAADRGKSCKRDSSHLVAKALEIDADVKRVSSAGGNFFDCNICFGMAREPILTCCGHLFCWACFHQLPYAYSSSKECPECKGEVTDTNITPIYGTGNSAHVSESKSLVKTPPRPQAHRKESVRQQRVSRVVSHIPVAEALRRIRTGISLTRERPQRQDLDGVGNNSDRTSMLASRAPTSEVLPNAEVGGSRRIRSHQFSRVLSESAASLSSISSALSNAERLVEDLESYIHDRVLRRTDSDSQFLGDYLTSNSVVLQSEHQTVGSTAEINSSEPPSSSSLRADVSAVGVHLENLTTDTAPELNLTVPRLSSSSRRRSGASRVSDVDIGFLRERRRRRLG